MILIIWVSLNFRCLIGFAQTSSERYPTAAEIEKARKKLRQQIRSAQNIGYLRDFRSPSAKTRRESFVSAWSRVDRSVAPFLGDWAGYEESLAVYPSNMRGRVCLIYIAPEIVDFSLGTIDNGVIRTNKRSVIIKEGNYLGIFTVIDNQADIRGETPYFSPKILRSAREYATSSSSIASEVEQVVRQFNAAGCTTSLPTTNRR